MNGVCECVLMTSDDDKPYADEMFVRSRATEHPEFREVIPRGFGLGN